VRKSEARKARLQARRRTHSAACFKVARFEYPAIWCLNIQVQRKLEAGGILVALYYGTGGIHVVYCISLIAMIVVAIRSMVIRAVSSRTEYR
jgi:hypothetical protein